MKKIKCQYCDEHKKTRTIVEVKKLLNRLNRIEGQVRGIKGMIESDSNCTDILIQVSAVNAALNSFNKELLTNHIRTCVACSVRNGKNDELDKLAITLRKLMK